MSALPQPVRERVPQQAAFDPAAWLTTFSARGGGYALTSDQNLCFLVGDCTAEDLTASMTDIAGQPDRLSAVKKVIENRSLGQVQ